MYKLSEKKMNKRFEISEELKNISPLVAGISNANVFTVPDGYFETLSDTVLICLHPINIVDNAHGNDIPVNYFNTLADTILAKIKAQEAITAADELKAISSVVAGINKTNLFEIPQEYFTNLPDAVLKTVNQQQHTKVISISSRWIKYAAAAVIIGAVALGVFKYANKPAIDISGTAVAAKLEPSIEKGKNMDDKKFDETLNNLSEEDIVKYLEKNGNDGDLAMLSYSVEENDLPKLEDYLLDNTTLDNFLQEIDNKSLKN